VSDTTHELLDFIDLDELAPGEPEMCGVVMDNGCVVALPNIHEDPVKGFRIEPKAFLEHVEQGAVATWHTHPGQDPTLSEEDLEGFRAWPRLIHLIVGVRKGEPAVEAYRVVEGGIVVRA
jgi:proteasome lid subunit RPN8/RPN11